MNKNQYNISLLFDKIWDYLAHVYAIYESSTSGFLKVMIWMVKNVAQLFSDEKFIIATILFGTCFPLVWAPDCIWIV